MGSNINYLTIKDNDGNVIIPGETWNPVTGCSGKGCKAKCWARDMVKRFPQIHGWDPDTEEGHVRGYSPLDFSKVNFHPDRLDKPLHWKKRRRIGVCFMGDLFDEHVPLNWIHQVWDVMKACPQHQFFILTKQPENMAKHVGMVYRKEALGAAMGFWNHVYLGVSVTDQPDADRMLPELLRIPGKKWISVEPQLAKIDLTRWLYSDIYVQKSEGEGHYERQRKRVSGTDCDGMVRGSRRWNNMEKGEINRGESHGKSSIHENAQNSSKSGEITVSKTPKNNVHHGGEKKNDGLFTSDRMDGSESSGHPRGNGDKPQGWDGSTQSSYQSGSSDKVSKLQTHGISPEENGKSSQIQESTHFQRQAEPITDFGDLSDVQKPHNESRENSYLIQRKREHGEEHILQKNVEGYPSISFIVLGAESGPKRRPASLEWFRSIRDQCKAAGINLFVKQMEINGKVTGDVNLFPGDLRIRQLPQQTNSPD